MIRSALRSSRLGLGLLATALVFFMVAACTVPTATPTPTATPQPVESIKVSLLVQKGDQETRWFRDLQVPKGADAFELTKIATGGDFKATYYPQYRSHFVEAILGTENQGSNYWLIWLWNDLDKKWEFLPVGADFYSVKDGQVLAWYYADTSQEGKPPPVTP